MGVNRQAPDYLYTSAPDEPVQPYNGYLAGHHHEPYGYHIHRIAGTKDWLFTFTLSGTGAFRLEDRVWNCSVGDIVIVPPNTPHHYATMEDSIWDFLWVHFIPRTEWASWFVLFDATPVIHSFHVDQMIVRGRVATAFEDLLRYSNRVGLLSEELTYNALERILLLTLQHVATPRNLQFDERVQQVLDYMTRHLAMVMTVEDLAKMVNLSSSRLAHLFKNQVGGSVVVVLRKARLRQAARMLRFTSKRIADIASDVGFQSPYYFTREFTREYGVSPRKYRQNALADETAQ